MSNKILPHETNTFGDCAYIAIAKHTRKFKKHEARVLADKNPEELHQMRVGMRRLRSAMTGFGLGLDLPKRAGEKNVGKVARILGELRDLDVLLDTLKNKYQPDLPPSEQKQLDQVLSHLQKQRDKALSSVKSTLKGKYYAKLAKSLGKWLKEPKYKPIAAVGIKHILPDLLLPQISKLFLHPGWLVGVKVEEGECLMAENLTPEEVENILDIQGPSLHDLRKEAKRSRYQMELFTQFYGDDYQSYLNDIKAIQAILGDLQDSAVLTQFLADILGQNMAATMPVFSKLLQDSRYQKWQQWRELQYKFLRDSTRQEFRIIIQQQNSVLDNTKETNKQENQTKLLDYN
jgi:CHAD domain-containing protein